MKRFLGSPILSFVLVLLTVFFIFFGLTKGDLQFWDESTNTAVVLESSRSPDWWNLRYDGEHFWEKPPLFYWIGIIFIKIFQNFENIYALRWISAVSAVFLVFSLGLILKVRKKGLLSVNVLLITLLSIPVLWLFSPTGTLATHNFRSFDSDVLQLLFISLSCLLIELYSKKSKKSLLIFGGIFMGLAVMTKGIFGFIPMVLLLVEGYKRFRNKKIDLKNLIFSILIFGGISLIVILPWHIYMYLNFGNEFISEYLLYHQLGRASEGIEGHAQPIYFYLLFLSDPKAGAILLSVFVVFISKIISEKNKFFSKENFSKWFLVGIFLLAVFAVIQTKISWYVLPAVLFFVLYVAENFSIKNKIISFALIGFFVFQILSNLQKVVTIPNAFNPEPENSITTYVTSSTPHRVFYTFELMGKIKKLEIGEIKSKTDIDDSKFPEKIYIDGNELTEIDSLLEGSNYRIGLTEAVSDNFVVAHLIKLN